MRSLLIPIFLFALGCGAGSSSVECKQNADCNLGPGGLCEVNAPTGNKWCTYPDTACETGRRWSDFEVGDGVSGACVAAGAVDAGAADAAVNDACVPATCESLAATCGTVANDGCGGALECGICVLPLSCGAGGVDNVCGGSCIPTQWTWTEIDDGLATGGDWSDFALDVSGGLHLAYHTSQPTPRLLYAYRANDGSAWNAGSVVDQDPAGLSAGFFPQVATDSSGGVHALHRKGGEPAPAHGYLATPGACWLIDDTLSPGFGTYVCLALDSSDGVHIAFDQSGGLQYMYRPNAGSWSKPALIEAGNVSECSIAVASDGHVHVAYQMFGASDESVRYANRPSGGTWSASEVDPIGQFPSLALDSAGAPHISYYSTSWGLRYANKPAANWVPENVDEGIGAPTTGEGSAIAIDGNDRIHISYRGVDRTQVKYATGFAGTWQKQTARTAAVGGRTSVSVDGAGGVHVISVEDDVKFTKGLWYGYRCP